MIEQEFDRVFNELFEDLLIRRWHGHGGLRQAGKSIIAEDEESYRVKIPLPHVDPENLVVEVTESRLTVRGLAGEGREQSTLVFSRRIDTERVTARFEAGILEVMLPKARGRKIEVS